MFKIFRKKVNIEDPVILRKQLETVQAVSHQLIKQTDLDETFSIMIKEIIKRLGYANISIYLISEDKKTFSVRKVNISESVIRLTESLVGKSINDVKLNLTDNNILAKSINKNEILFSNSFYEIFYPLFSEGTASMVQKATGIKSVIMVPIEVDNISIGCLAIGSKNEKFEGSEVEVISTFSDQVSIAIYNAQLFEKIQNQISDLEDRNKQLDIINKFINKITTTLEVEETAQTAIDSISEILGYLGGVYSYLDKERGLLKLLTYSQNKYLEAGFKIINKTPNNLVLSLNDAELQNSFNIRAIKEDKIFLSSNLSDIAKTILPPYILDKVQQTLGIKTIACVPVKSNNEVIGIINFIIQNKSPEQLTELDKNTMAIISNQIGTALEKAALFEKTQSALSALAKSYQRDKEMLDILGHELRTPATVCKGTIELMMSYVDKEQIDAGTKNYLKHKLDIAYSTIKKEASLIEELLTATKLDSGQMVIMNQQVDMYQLAKTTYQNFLDAAQKHNLELRFVEPAAPIPMTVGDSVRLGEVLDNLVSNSIKYTKSGFIEISIDSDQQRITIHVKDSGNGISKDEIPELFQKFHRIHNYIDDKSQLVRPGGTGLGLYVSKGIIEAHNGKIWAESGGEGKGSTFSFSIPIRQMNKDATLEIPQDESDMFEKMEISEKKAV